MGKFVSIIKRRRLATYLLFNKMQSDNELTLSMLLEKLLQGKKNDDKMVEQIIAYLHSLSWALKEDAFSLCLDCWSQSNQEVSLLLYQQMIRSFLDSQNEAEQTMQGMRNIMFQSIFKNMEKTKENDKYGMQKLIFFINHFQILMLDCCQFDVYQLFSSVDSSENLVLFKRCDIKKSFQNYFHVNNYMIRILRIMGQKNIWDIEDESQLHKLLFEIIKLAYLLSTDFDHTQIEFTDPFITFLQNSIYYIKSTTFLESLMNLLIDLTTSLGSKFIRDRYRLDINTFNCMMRQLNIYNCFFLRTSLKIVLGSQIDRMFQIQFLKQIKLMLIDNSYNQKIFREQISFSFLLKIIREDQDKEKVQVITELLQQAIKLINNELMTDLMEIFPNTQPDMEEPYAFRMIRKDLFSQYVGSILQNIDSYEDVDAKTQQSQLQLLSKNSGIIIKNFNELVSWKHFTIMFEIKLDGYKFINQECSDNMSIQKETQTIFYLTDEDRNSNICYLSIGITLGQDDLTYIVIKYLDEKMNEAMISHQVDFTQEQILGHFILTLVFDQNPKDKSKDLTLFVDNQKYSVARIRLSLKTFFEKRLPIISLGAALLRGTNYNFDSHSALQGQIRNFICYNGCIPTFLFQEMIERYNNRGEELIEIIKEELKQAFEKFQKDQEIIKPYKSMSEVHHLSIKSFPPGQLDGELQRIKEGIRIIKMEENLHESHFLGKIFSKNKFGFKLIQSRNKQAKIFFRNVFRVDHVSLADMFMSLERMDLIYFIISLTTSSPVLNANEDNVFNHSSSLFPKSEAIIDSTIYKIKKYHDCYMRSQFVVKAQGKSKEQYVNLNQFQEEFLKKIRISNETRANSPRRPIQNKSSKPMEFSLKLMNDRVDEEGEEISLFEREPTRQKKQFDSIVENNFKSISNEAQISEQTTTPTHTHPHINQLTSDQDSKDESQLIYSSYLQSSLIENKAISNQVEVPDSPSEEPVKVIPKRSEKRMLSLKVVKERESIRSEDHVSPKQKQTKTPSGRKMFTMNHINSISSEKGKRRRLSSEELVKLIKRIPNLQDSNLHDTHYAEIECEYVTLKGNYFGNLSVTREFIVFESYGAMRPEDEYHQYGTQIQCLKSKDKTKKIMMDQVEMVQTRRFNLKEIAVELFLKNTKIYFFNLYQHSEQLNFLKILGNYSINCKIVQDRRQAFQSAQYTQQWQKGELSNFQYLMLVNQYSGRTFNDINQYPVFPWVLQDYTSEKLNLDNPKVYRDLSVPIGAINKERLADFKLRADTLQGDQPYFHYGTHYQTPAYIIHFLMRVEPFLSLAQELQNGKFDNADRMFHSIEGVWNSSQENSADVRELIPEFFYFGEMFTNLSGIDFGKRSNSEVVSNVRLPRWAQTPQEFVYLHRQALESEYVSNNLDKWLNLIFGIWQHGEEAKKRDNLFYWTTYEQNLERIDKMPYQDRQCTIEYIQSFGQTPYQLFTKVHPQRDKQLKLQIFDFKHLSPNKGKNNGLSAVESTKLHKFEKPVILMKKVGPYLYLVTSTKQLFKIKYTSFSETKKDKKEKNINEQYVQLETGEKLELNTSKIYPYQMTVASSPQTKNKLSMQSLIVSYSASRQFYFMEDFIWIAGFETGYVCGMSIPKVGQQLHKHSIKLHKKTVTCVDQRNNILCLAGRDHRITVWNLPSNGEQVSFKTPQFILYGHEESIQDLKIVESSSIVISVDKIGKVLFHSIKSAEFLREVKLDLDRNEKVRLMEVDEDGLLVFLTNYNNILVSTWNGFMRKIRTNKMITKMMTYQKDNLLLSTTEGGIYLLSNFVRLLSPNVEFSTLSQLLYQNQNKMCIQNFMHFYNSDSLIIVLSYIDGQVHQVVIRNESDINFRKGLRQAGLFS